MPDMHEGMIRQASGVRVGPQEVLPTSGSAAASHHVDHHRRRQHPVP